MGEVTGSILPNDNAATVRNRLMSLSSITTVRVNVLISLQTEWKLIITAQDITENANVVVTQTIDGVTSTGTLKIATGTGTTSITIENDAGVTFSSTANLLIGSTTVLAANIQTATNNIGLVASESNDKVCGGTNRNTVLRIYFDEIVGYPLEDDMLPLVQVLSTRVQRFTCRSDPLYGNAIGSFALTYGATTLPISVTSSVSSFTSILENVATVQSVDVRYVNNNALNTWHLATTTSLTPTEIIGVTVTQNEWTFTITSESITQIVGSDVTQGSSTGTLQVALNGDTTVIIVQAAAGISFATTANLLIGTGATQTTIANANLLTAKNSVSNTGTLQVALNGDAFTSIFISSSSSIFTTTTNLIVGSTTILHADLTLVTRTPYPCSSDGNTHVLITMVDVNAFSDLNKGTSLLNRASMSPSLYPWSKNEILTMEVAAVSGTLTGTNIFVSDVLSVQQDRLKQGNGGDTNEWASFHISGSAHAISKSGTINFQHKLINRQTERKISVDKKCNVPYELLYTLVSNGGTIIPDPSWSNNIQSASFTIYSGAAHHLSVIQQPDFVSVWPSATIATKRTMELQPKVGIYDAGHNLAEWVTNTPIVANLEIHSDATGGASSGSDGVLSTSMDRNGIQMNSDSAAVINTIKGISTFSMLRMPWNTNIKRIGRLSFNTKINVDVATLYKTWTFTMTSATPTAETGATVTQGSATGTLQIALTGSASTSVVVTALSTVTFSTTEDLNVGSTTLAHANLITVTSTNKYSNVPLPQGLVGSNKIGRSLTFPIVSSPHTIRFITQPLISLDNKVPFTISGEVLDMYGNRVIQYDDATTGFINGESLPNIHVVLSTWHDPRCPIFCATLKTEWVITIAAQAITENEGVTVTQGTSVGILKTSLTGTGMTSVVISASFGVSFITTTHDLVIGSTPVVHANINTAIQSKTANRGIVTFTNLILTLPSNLPSDGTSDSNVDLYRRTVQTVLLLEEGDYRETTGWLININPTVMNEHENVIVTQANGKIRYVYTIAAQDITKNVGVTVTQGTSTGMLKTALTGTDEISVVIESSLGVLFNTAVNLIIDSSGASPVTVLVANLKSISSTTTPHAQGTLRDSLLSGASLRSISSVEINCLAGITFDTSVDLVIGETIISQSTLTAATVSSPQHFRLNLNLSTIDSGRVLRDYSTTNIAYDSSALALKEILQAIPHIGSVDVTKTSRDQKYIDTWSRANYTAWQITFLSMDDDIMPMTIRENNGNADIVVQETMVPKHYKLEMVLNSPLGYFPSRGFRLDSKVTNTFTITAQGITEKEGVVVTQGLVKGTLKTTLQNEWTMTITAQAITENVGVTVTQGSAIGTLKTALIGNGVTSVVILCDSGVVFLNNVNLVVGSSTVGSGTLSTASNSGSSTVVVVKSKVGSVFDVGSDLVVGGTTVVQGNLGSEVVSVTV